MKILFACPRDSSFAASFSEKGAVSVPLGLAYLAAYVKDISDIEISGFDNNALKFPANKIREIIRNESPDIVAISILTPTIFNAWEMSRIVKKVNPKTIVIAGGMHCSALPEDAMKEKSIDYCIIGEGEEAFKELILAIKDSNNISGIKNLAYRHDDKIVVNERRSAIAQLDDIPFPERTIFDNSRYGMNVNRSTSSKKSTTLLTSRGCPYECVFCSKSIYGNTFNQRTPNNVIDELIMLEKNGYGEVLIVDDTFTVNKRWVLTFCEFYQKNNLRISWNCHARVNTINEEIVSKMKEINCTGMAFGIESGNPGILKSINKMINLDQAYNAVKLCKKYQIRTLCSYIFGHPGDTYETVNDTLKVALDLDSDYANFCIFIPMPGSQIFNQLSKTGSLDITHWDHYLAHTKNTFNVSLCELSPDELKRVQKKAFRKYYFRPKYVYKKLKSIGSIKSLYNMIKGLYMILLFQIQSRLKR